MTTRPQGKKEKNSLKNQYTPSQPQGKETLRAKETSGTRNYLRKRYGDVVEELEIERGKKWARQ